MTRSEPNKQMKVGERNEFRKGKLFCGFRLVVWLRVLGGALAHRAQPMRLSEIRSQEHILPGDAAGVFS
jgi:hypothetical protein